MTWCALSNNGVSRVYVAEKGGTMNKERYHSIFKSHLPFIDAQCDGRDNCIFWPHYVSSHYATDVQTWFTSENVDFVKWKTTLQTVPS